MVKRGRKGDKIAEALFMFGGLFRLVSMFLVSLSRNAVNTKDIFGDWHGIPARKNPGYLSFVSRGYYLRPSFSYSKIQESIDKETRQNNNSCRGIYLSFRHEEYKRTGKHDKQL